ncbi:MAG: hypothetical protein JW772_02935 [Candidatus Diapherotrites archaeon]|nr:hypothetical protein [Candidatus Diapherotrites archaeon]
MDVPNFVWAVIVFGIIVISSGFLIGQANSFFAQALAGKISGTIVLKDSADTSGAATFVLPGSNCSMRIVGCGTDFVVSTGEYFDPVNYGATEKSHRKDPRMLAIPVDAVGMNTTTTMLSQPLVVGSDPKGTYWISAGSLEGIFEQFYEQPPVRLVKEYGESRIYYGRAWIGMDYEGFWSIAQDKVASGDTIWIANAMVGISHPECSFFQHSEIESGQYYITPATSEGDLEYLVVSYSCSP